MSEERHSGPAFDAAVAGAVEDALARRERELAAKQRRDELLCALENVRLAKQGLSYPGTGKHPHADALEHVLELLWQESEVGYKERAQLSGELAKCKGKADMIDTVVEVYKGLADGLGNVEEGQLSETAASRVTSLTRAKAAQWGGGSAFGVILADLIIKWLGG